LIANLKSIPSYSSWKDLTKLIELIILNEVGKHAKPKSQPKPKKEPAKNRNQKDPSKMNDQHRQSFLFDLARGVQDGSRKKKEYIDYLRQLQTPEEKKKAKVCYADATKRAQAEHKKQAEDKKKAKKKMYMDALSRLMDREDFAVLYQAVAEAFASTLKSDSEHLKTHGSLPPYSLAAKWAPSIEGAVNRKTSLGKHIALKLSSFMQADGANKSKKQMNTEALVNYRKTLTSLRLAIGIPETLMSQNR
jgi:hypothetical protein